jgi:bifunctional DNA-binding transcriptional regulator/antitoxin component of YhaV-PrlF toxin-antitoxin module
MNCHNENVEKQLERFNINKKDIVKIVVNKNYYILEKEKCTKEEIEVYE